MNYLSVTTSIEFFYSRAGRRVGVEASLEFMRDGSKSRYNAALDVCLKWTFAFDRTDSSVSLYAGPFILEFDTF